MTIWLTGYYLNNQTYFNIRLNGGNAMTFITLAGSKKNIGCWEKSPQNCGHHGLPPNGNVSPDLLLLEMHLDIKNSSTAINRPGYAMHGSYYNISGPLFTCNKIGELLQLNAKNCSCFLFLLNAKNYAK
jgi:hypothetical protein